MDRVRSEMVERAIGKLTALGDLTVDGLKALLEADGAPAIRLGAIRTALARQLADLRRRLEELEDGDTHPRAGEVPGGVGP